MAEQSQVETPELAQLGKAGAPPKSVAFQPLGIGLSYMQELPAHLYRSPIVDFVEITPETLCREIIKDGRRQMMAVPSQIELAKATCRELPVVIHGVELSIGSEHGWNQAYVDLLDRMSSEFPFLWHSEHLSFQTITDDIGEIVEIGLPMPLPITEEAIAVVSDRCAMLQHRYGKPFLLENPAHYLPELPCDPEVGNEAEFMNCICRRSGCSLLLDIHNLYCNATNAAFDAYQFIDRLSLESVIEIHVSGGRQEDGFWTDAHEGRVPDPVWELLRYTLPRCRNVSGVLFEIFPDYAHRLGANGVQEELEKIRSIWNSQPTPSKTP